MILVLSHYFKGVFYQFTVFCIITKRIKLRGREEKKWTLILNRLCFSSSTYNTFSIEVFSEFPMLPTQRIFPLLLSPQVTKPLSFAFKETNLVLSPVICLEHLLLRYHISCLTSRHTHKTVQGEVLVTQEILGHLREKTCERVLKFVVSLGIHLY